MKLIIYKKEVRIRSALFLRYICLAQILSAVKYLFTLACETGSDENNFRYTLKTKTVQFNYLFVVFVVFIYYISHKRKDISKSKSSLKTEAIICDITT